MYAAGAAAAAIAGAAFLLAARRRRNQNASRANTASAPTPTPTPTPTPIFPPVERPLDPESDAAESEVDVAVAPVPVVVESDVLVADTNRLESVAWSWIEIGCAHMVNGPETCVPWFDLGSRTETMVELDDGSVLRHPA